MTPHVVYVPDGEVRELRRLLARRAMIKRDLKRWQVRRIGRIKGVARVARDSGLVIVRTPDVPSRKNDTRRYWSCIRR
jgi:hypothetical protein